ncbi:MAG: hypothetical protein QOJ04_4541, partial [Caballeronia sp.]|nr:hypothetical protein [Caballeronia sp.]
SPLAEGRVDVPRRPRLSPVLWLNLVCLDAPLVAVAWLWLFARTFRIPLQAGNGVALFLTAWLIYLGDRLADSASLEPDGPQSLRQQFCRRHSKLWIILIALVAGFDGYIIWRTTAWETFLVGAGVGGLALIYLVINHPLGLIWRSLPAKELAIGGLFTAGILVALMPTFSFRQNLFAMCALLFAALCALNCISIASWERELDQAQGKVSIATRHPSFTRHAALICAVLAVTSLILAIVRGPAAPIFACISMSALLLAWLNVSADPQGAAVYKPPFLDVDSDQRTALADLVLLTPIAALIAASL